MNRPQIASPDMNAMRDTQEILANLDITDGGLGRLTTLSMRLAGMTGRTNWFPSKRAILIFAGDHGVMNGREQQSTTAQRVELTLAQKSAVNSLSRQMGTRLIVIDAGVNHQFKPRPRALVPLIGAEMRTPTFIQRKIAMGTNDITQENAMTAEQAEKAIQLGMTIVQEEQKRGIDLLFLGVIGVGSLYAATAILTGLTGKSVHTNNDIPEVVKQAVERHESPTEDILMKLGGFEIGAITGAILYAASQRIPIIIDGLACTAGALIAHQIEPNIHNYLIAGHKSDEAGHALALGYLGLDPLLEMSIRMGEGAGALLAYPMIEAAMRTLNEVGKRDVE